jgi:hypothetical protein
LSLITRQHTTPQASIGGGRRAVELEVIFEETNKHIFEIHDGRIFDVLK